MRAKKLCHKKDIISADYSHNLGLIATGGRDHNIRLWDYEKMKFEIEIQAHYDEVTKVKFLKPFPLLFTADSKGVMYIWLIPPHREGRKCLVKWVNGNSMEDDVPISAIDFYADIAKEEYYLLIGDEKGEAKIFEISRIIQRYKLVPIDNSKDPKRNPHRCLPVEVHNLDRNYDGTDNIDLSTEIALNKNK